MDSTIGRVEGMGEHTSTEQANFAVKGIITATLSGSLVLSSSKALINQIINQSNQSINQSIKIVKRCDKDNITKNKCQLQRLSVDLSMGWILLENSRFDYCTQIRLTLKDERN